MAGQMPKMHARSRQARHDGPRDELTAVARDWQTNGLWGCTAVSRATLALTSGGGRAGWISINQRNCGYYCQTRRFQRCPASGPSQRRAGNRDRIPARLGSHLPEGMGLLTNSSRGVWALTDDGTALLTDPSATDDQRSERIRELRARYLNDLRTARKTRLPQDDGEQDDVQPSTERSWKEQLLEQLMSMAPDAFERLARRLLREADFDSVNVTGQTGDGGIDGLGVYRLGLVSFPVFCQCKRYRGSVSPSAVRDFRGAMAGRGDKGLLITTGTFTADAKKEATRDGAPPIDLIDGDRLCELLKRYDLGVRTTTRTVEDVAIDVAFFADM
jgi:restriction system protein